jgi:signal transduction histidine kinase
VNTAGRRRLALIAWLFGVVAFTLSLALSAFDHHFLSWVDVSQASAFFAIGTVGLVLARRRPENPVGWLYLAVWTGVATAFGLFSEYARWAAVTHHPGAFGATTALWLSNWAWVPIFGALLTFPFLLFPDGRLPSPRWRRVGWACGIVTVLWSIAFAFEGADFTDALNRHVANPYAIAGLTAFFDAAREVLAVAFIGLVAACVASLVVRFRRSLGDERQQIKWLMLSGAIFVVWLAVPLNHGNGGWPDALQGFFIALLPISVGVAILKYRLFDVDVVINRTVLYGALAVFITVVYAAIVVGIGAAVGNRRSPFLSALAAAVVAVAFQPARRRAQRLADRLVYGARATPYEVLSEFSGRLAGTYATDDLLPRMVRILAEGTNAARADVWLRADDELRPAATFPVEAMPLPAVAAAALPSNLVEVRHQGELLGALSVEKRPGESTTPTESKLIQDLAAQAGLVLRNVGLTQELLRRLDELQASRQRLVAAQDEERRKLERNLHDGAQQQLVALAVKLRLADMAIDADSGKAHAAMAELQGDASEALENLRDLARGIYPPLLADKGLAAALEAQARKAPLPVEIHAENVGRFTQEAEAAVYFCCLEALQNIGKYAKASHATVRLSNGAGGLMFQVVDDGCGFDPSSTGYGTGLQGMADRLAVLDGSLEVRSTPGGGTTVTGRVPADALPEGRG